MIFWRRREWFWPIRYGLMGAASIGLGLIVLGLIFFRPWVEPLVRMAYGLLTGSDLPSDPRFYLLLTGALALLTAGLTAYSLATHRAVDRKIDRFLASRRPDPAVGRPAETDAPT